MTLRSDRGIVFPLSQRIAPRSRRQVAALRSATPPLRFGPSGDCALAPLRRSERGTKGFPPEETCNPMTNTCCKGQPCGTIGRCEPGPCSTFLTHMPAARGALGQPGRSHDSRSIAPLAVLAFDFPGFIRVVVTKERCEVLLLRLQLSEDEEERGHAVEALPRHQTASPWETVNNFAGATALGV